MKTHPIACAKTWAPDHGSTTFRRSIRKRRSHVEKTIYPVDDMARFPGHHPARRTGSLVSMVFWKGLGITNLTDLVPWGLWITIDLSSIALGAGAFSLCAGVYLFGLEALPADCTHCHLRWLDRLHHGNACADPGYRQARTLLALAGLLEYTFPAVGSDHVRGPVSDRPCVRIHADPCQPGMAAQAPAEDCSNDGTCPSLCTHPGDRRTGAFQPAPVIARRDLWCDQSPTVLVQT